MLIKLSRVEPWHKYYRTQDGVLVSFQMCTIGKYKGKVFMSVYSESVDENNIKNIREEYLMEVTKEIELHYNQRSVCILDLVEVSKEMLNRTEVFFNFARKGRFQIDEGKTHKGYTFEEYWNGWDCPLFTKRVALNICKEFTYNYDNAEQCRCFYDKETDKFYCEDYNNDYERQEIGTPTEINTDNGIIKVYDFGVAGWIWSEC